jgi:hypothetical protein
VRAGRIHAGGDGETEDLDEDAALGSHRAATAPALVVEGRAGAAASDRLGIDHHHGRGRLAMIGDADRHV